MVDTRPYIPNMPKNYLPRPDTCEQRLAREYGIDPAPDPLAYTDRDSYAAAKRKWFSYAAAKRKWIYAAAECEWAESLKHARVRPRMSLDVLGTVKSVRHFSGQSYALVEWDDGLLGEHPVTSLQRVYT